MTSIQKDEMVVHYEDGRDFATTKDLSTNEQPVMDEEWHRKGRRVVKKLDMTLMPIVWLLYLFNYLDRNNIAQAKVLSSQTSRAVSNKLLTFAQSSMESKSILAWSAINSTQPCRS
jgi:hypothetical protein